MATTRTSNRTKNVGRMQCSNPSPTPNLVPEYSMLCELEACLEVAFERMSEENQKAFLALHKVPSDVRAVRRIAPGDETLIAYVNALDEPIARKRQRIFSKYKFTCKCGSCVSSDSDLIALSEKFTQPIKYDVKCIT
ncbi:hypothetical protein BDQ17DRAFT_1339938 [Cyathus striatus]|nr:hypothetical protein BDQ17DRAFT_1339938 [Cyathus striatus]